MLTHVSTDAVTMITSLLTISNLRQFCILSIPIVIYYKCILNMNEYQFDINLQDAYTIYIYNMKSFGS